MADVKETELKTDAHKEHFEFWTKAGKADERGMVYDASIFNRKELDGSADFTSNDSYLFAALKINEMDDGGLFGADNDLNDLLAKHKIDSKSIHNLDDLRSAMSSLSPAEAGELKGEMVDFAQNYISWFNKNIGATGKIALKITGSDASDEQKKAFLYVMHASDHTESMTLKNTGRFIYQGLLTDPTTWAVGVAGFFTGGTGGVALQGGRMAAGRGAVAGLEKLVESGIAKTAAGHIVTTATRKMAAREAGHAVGKAGLKGVGEKVLDSQIAYWGRGKFMAPALSGAIFGAADNSMRQGTEISATHATGEKRGFSWGELGTSTAVGFGFGGVIGGVGASISHNVTAWRASGSSSTRTTATITPVAPKGAKTSSGIEMPEFKQKTDIFKRIAVGEFNPTNVGFWTGMRNFMIPVRAFRVDCTKTVRPVIEAMDEHVAQLKIGSKIRQFEKDVLKAIDDGADDAAINSMIVKFSSDNKAALREFRKSIKELRTHVGTYFNTNENSTLKHGLTKTQKETLLKELEYAENLAKDIGKGRKSDFAKQILDKSANIRSGIISTDDIRKSFTGLSAAGFFSTESLIRHTGKWPPEVNPLPKSGEKVYAQWVERLERSINESYFNPNRRNRIISHNEIVNENLEHTSFSEVLNAYAGRDDKGALATKLRGTPATASETFVDVMKKYYAPGYDHEALYLVDTLRRLRQPHVGWRIVGPKAGVDQAILPDETNLRDAFKKDPRYKTDAEFTNWADTLIKRATAHNPGLNVWWKDFFEKPTRAAMHLAYTHYLPWDYAMRWRSAGAISKPGQMHLSKIAESIATIPYAYFTGAKSISYAKKNPFGTEVTDYENISITYVDSAAGEGTGSRLRRAFTRIGTGGLVSDLGTVNVKGIPLPIIPKLSSTGWLTAAGGAAWGYGEATDSDIPEFLGRWTVQGTTFLARPVWEAGADLAGIDMDGDIDFTKEGPKLETFVKRGAAAVEEKITGGSTSGAGTKPPAPSAPASNSANPIAEFDALITAEEAKTDPKASEVAEANAHMQQAQIEYQRAQEAASAARKFAKSKKEVAEFKAQREMDQGLKEPSADTREAWKQYNEAQKAFEDAEKKRLDAKLVHDDKKQSHKVKEAEQDDIARNIESLKLQRAETAIGLHIKSIENDPQAAKIKVALFAIFDETTKHGKKAPTIDMNNPAYLDAARWLAANAKYDEKGELDDSKKLDEALRTAMLQDPFVDKALKEKAQKEQDKANKKLQQQGGGAPASGGDSSNDSNLVSGLSSTFNDDSLTPGQKFSAGMGQVGNSVSGFYRRNSEWLGSEPGGFVDGVGNVLSGTFGLVGNLFGDLKEGNIENGNRILGIGGGIAAALIGTKMIKGMLPQWAQNIPGLGLLLASALFLFAGEAISKATAKDKSDPTKPGDPNAATQGKGEHLPNAIKPQIITETLADGTKIVLDDSDADEEFAVQISSKDGKKTFADFKLLDGEDAVQAGLDSNVIFVPKSVFMGRKMEEKGKSFEAITHNTQAANDEIFYVRANGTDGSVQTLAIRNADPAPEPGQ